MNDLLTEKNCEQHTEPQGYEGRLLIIKPEKLRTEFRKPYFQYFFAESGFGCYPDVLGTKVFGRFLSDNQRGQLYRDDFIGIADKAQLPKWAARRLEKLAAPKMMIRVFQIDSAKDWQNVEFMDHEYTVKHGGVKAENYRQVYGWEVFGNSLENLFYLCNNEHPPGYCGHSLSVSDVVEVCDGSLKGFWFCDRIGFKKLDGFDISKTDRSEVMKILVLENDRAPYPAEIIHNVDAMQSVVGGPYDVVYFEPKGDAICWCNDEFLLNGFAPNRMIGDTLIHGTCFISGDGCNEYGERDACSLTDKQIELYSGMFPQSVICLEDTMTEEQEQSEEQSEDIGQTMT